MSEEKETVNKSWNAVVNDVIQQYEEGDKFVSQIYKDLIAALRDPVKTQELKKVFSEWTCPDIGDEDGSKYHNDGYGCYYFNKTTGYDAKDCSQGLISFLKSVAPDNAAYDEHVEHVRCVLVKHGMPDFEECKLWFLRTLDCTVIKELEKLFHELEEFKTENNGVMLSQWLRLVDLPPAYRERFARNIFVHHYSLFYTCTVVVSARQLEQSRGIKERLKLPDAEREQLQVTLEKIIRDAVKAAKEKTNG